MFLSMLRWTIRLSLLLIIVLIAASCGHSDNLQSSPVVLTASDSGSKVSLQQGQSISVSLQENSTTGYIWEIVPGSELLLAEQGTSQFVADSNAIGSGGVRTFKFMAIASGNCTLKLIYHQPWMTSVAPAQTFEVSIVIGS